MIIAELDFYDRILYIFNWAVSWILVGIHRFLVFVGMNDGVGYAWVFSIIGLTLVVRSAIIPLYAKQINSQRAMQEIQPKIQAINEKYKGRKDQVSQQQKNQEVFALYREHGVNPMASCLPLLIQMPFILALYRVLLATGPISKGTWGIESLGPITRTVAEEIEKSRFLGIPLSTTFGLAHAEGHFSWMVIIVVMAVVMAAIMFASTWLLSVKNLPKSASDQNARMMRMMAIIGPLMTLTFSFVVQMGVLVYWLVTNIFTAVQQMVILHKAPTMGSPAHDRFLERAGKKFDAYKEQQESEYRSLLDNLGLSEREVNDAWQRIQRAEAKSDADVEIVIDPSSARFKSTKSLRRDVFKQRHDALDADATRQRLGDGDPFNDHDQADALHRAVAARRQMELRLKEKRVELGIERVKTVPSKKKGLFARRMEEAMKMQQNANASARGGQRVQPSKATRAKRQDDARKNREDQAQKKPAGSLTAEEIERRRIERRQKARSQAKKKRK